MAKYFLVILLCLFILAGGSTVWANKDFEKFKFSLLLERKDAWPNWHLPAPFKRSGFADAVFFPQWLEGEWQVISLNLDDPEIKFIRHLARFYSDSYGRIIADRIFNSESLGHQVLGENLLYVKEDSNTPNRQLAVLKGNKYLETKVLAREQQMNDSDVFLFDEIVLQILHSNEKPNINQVETLSKFSQCTQFTSSLEMTTNNPWVCGEQWQAIYNDSAQFFESNPLYTTHYQIFLIPLESTIPSDDFLIHLANRTVALTQDDQ